MVFIYNTTIFSGKPGKWIAFDRLENQDDGSVTAVYPDGSVLSIQPNGSWDTRSSGTAGQYERGMLNGSVIAFNPAGSPYPYPLVNTI